MKELVILSGKGGTGKTSITASFAALAADAVLADCDVDAADLHLLLAPVVRETHPFFAGNEAVIRPEACRSCGVCFELCRFEAVKITDGSVSIDPYACEGCGVCAAFCPERAIDFPARNCGEWYESETASGPMVHAKLAPAAENSGKLVSQVRKAAREIAEREDRTLILVDGPPGIGCPVIASLSGVSAVLVVTEPTVSGEHDLVRVLRLAMHFQIPALVCLNKWDLNPEATARIEAKAAAAGAEVVGRIPYDRVFTEAMVAGCSVIRYGESAAAESIHKLWENVCRKM